MGTHSTPNNKKIHSPSHLKIFLSTILRSQLEDAGDVITIREVLSGVSTSAFVFKIKYHVFLDTLSQKIFFLDMRIDNFKGDLTDISAQKEPLVSTLDIHSYSYKTC